MLQNSGMGVSIRQYRKVRHKIGLDVEISDICVRNKTGFPERLAALQVGYSRINRIYLYMPLREYYC